MISDNPKDYKILENILNKYPLTIYAYDSRVKEKPQKFSDLDLFIFDNTYKKLDLLNLQKDLQKSNLPFTVNVTLWSLMDEDFQNLIQDDLILLQANPPLVDFEQNILSKIFYFSEELNFKIEERSHYTFIDSGLDCSMFNIVYQKSNISLSIEEAIDYYQNRDFSYVFTSDSWSNNMINSLTKNKFYREANEKVMMLSLESLKLLEVSKIVETRKVTTVDILKDFSYIIENNDKRAYGMYFNEKIIKSDFIEKSPHFVGYVDGVPVTTGSLHFGKNGSTRIYNISVLLDYRGKNIASNMVKYLINQCKEQNFKEVLLFSSNKIACRIYENLGFKTIGKFEYSKYKG